jgi:hypothetical protein
MNDQTGVRGMKIAHANSAVRRLIDQQRWSLSLDGMRSGPPFSIPLPSQAAPMDDSLIARTEEQTQEEWEHFGVR